MAAACLVAGGAMAEEAERIAPLGAAPLGATEGAADPPPESDAAVGARKRKPPLVVTEGRGAPIGLRDVTPLDGEVEGAVGFAPAPLTD